MSPVGSYQFANSIKIYCARTIIQPNDLRIYRRVDRVR